MINDNLVHQREADSNTESFLQENVGKFESDCVFLLKLMLRGERLTRQEVVGKYKLNDRRLGDLFTAGKCERRWKYGVNAKGKPKRLYVEYFITTTSIPNKKSVTEMWNTLMSNGNGLKQQEIGFV